MIAGGAAGILVMHEATSNFHKYMNPAKEDILNKAKLKEEARAAHDAFNAVKDEYAEAKAAFEEYEKKYNQNTRYQYSSWKPEEYAKYDPKITWEEMYKLQVLRDEKERAISHKEKSYRTCDKLLNDAGKLKDKLAAMRWTTSDVVGYAVVAAVCWYVAYTGWQAPYRAYNNAKGIAGMLRFGQKRAFEQSQHQIPGSKEHLASIGEQKK